MTQSRSRVPAWEWPCLLAVMAVLGVAFAATQQRVIPERAHDGNYYLLIADQIQRGQHPETIEPFVTRVGTPWLAAAVAGATGLSIPSAFFVINIVGGALGAMLFAVWLRAHVADAVTRVTLVVFYLISPYSPFRWTFYYPTLTDPPAMVFVILGLIALDRMARKLDAPGAIALTVIVAVGCAFRELVVALAIAALLLRPWMARPSQWIWRVAPLIGGSTLIVLRSWIAAAPSSYSMASAVTQWLVWKSALMVVVAACFAFGPLRVLLLQYWRVTWRFAVERPDVIALAGIFFAGGWLSASDTERIFEFAVPVVLMLIGRTLAGFRLAGVRQAFVVIVVLQLLCYRAMLPIAGRFLVFFSEHFSFYTTWLDPITLQMFLVCYLVAMGLVMAMTWSAPFVSPYAEISTAPRVSHL